MTKEIEEVEVEEKPKKKKGKTGYLEGIEPVRNKKLDRLMDNYVSCRDARMKGLEAEVAAKDTLIAALKETGITYYENDEFKCTLESKEKVKVKRQSDVEEEEEE